MEGCLVQERVPWEVLAKALAGIFNLDPTIDIREFDVDNLVTPPPAVQVEINEHESGFRMDLTFYLGANVEPELTGPRFASHLAAALGQDVLTSPPAEIDGQKISPALWLLVRSTGELFLVRQIDPESEDVDIDRSPKSMRRVSSLVGWKA